MTTIMIERDDAAGATANSYHCTRVVEIAGHTVRARIERDFHINQSLAVAEILSDQITWTILATDAPSNWWHDAPTPSPDVHAATILGPLADRLLHRAAGILAAPPTTWSWRPTSTARSARCQPPVTASMPNTASTRIRSAPFPRIHALLDAIGDAEIDVGDRHYRCHLPGPDGRLTPTWVDEIDVPV